METPPDSSSLLPRPGQLIRPQQIDVCVATRGAGSGAQPDGETVPCGPPQIGAQRGADKGYEVEVRRHECDQCEEGAMGGYPYHERREAI